MLGLGDALVLTTNNAVCCLAWGEHKAKFLGIMLGGSGLGTITAPVIGGLLFNGFKKFGDDYAFFAALMFYSLFLLINIVIC